VLRDADALTRDPEQQAPSTVARMGGDEFLLAVGDLPNGEAASIIAARLLEHLRHPLIVDGNELFVSASVGIAVYPDDGTEFGELLKHADAALYHAKDAGRNTMEFYNRSMSEAAMQRLVMETSLRRSMERGDLTINVQPIVDARAGRIIGGEALVRWTHPEHGKVCPSQFVPLAERLGLVAPLTEMVMRQACAAIAAWDRDGITPEYVAINMSPKLFEQPGLLEELCGIPAEYGVRASRLILEVTETALFENPAEVERVLRQLVKLGFRVALDDFGTGYSSLSHLRRFPIHALKIDRSFLRDLTRNANDAAIVRALTGLARSLGLEPIAEGVEDPVQRDAMLAAGCHVMQGYFYSVPLSLPEFTQVLRDQLEGTPPGLKALPSETVAAV
jgi:predicted signal transduction protein with EAL and GGDEF domain